MNNEFQIGDVVVLISGGPKMTVSSIQLSNNVSCMWFDGPVLFNATFNQDALKMYEDSKINMNYWD